MDNRFQQSEADEISMFNPGETSTLAPVHSSEALLREMEKLREENLKLKEENKNLKWKFHQEEQCPSCRGWSKGKRGLKIHQASCQKKQQK